MLESASDNEIVGNTLAETGDAGIVLGRRLAPQPHRGQRDDRRRRRRRHHQPTPTATIVIGNTAHLGSDAGMSLSNAARQPRSASNDVRFNPTGVDLSGVQRQRRRGQRRQLRRRHRHRRLRLLRNESPRTPPTTPLADGIAVEAEAVDAAGLPDPSIGNDDRGQHHQRQPRLRHHRRRGRPHDRRQHRQQQRRLGHRRRRDRHNVDGGGNTASGNADTPRRAPASSAAPARPHRHRRRT